MGSFSDLIEKPLTTEQLAQRYRALSDDPRFANLPGKVELDVWGRITVSPASNLHALLQGRLIQRLAPLGGEALAEASVATSIGIIVADIAWLSPDSASTFGTVTPYPRAPDLCIEIVSPSNSRTEIEAKIQAYLGSGAKEVWIVDPAMRRIDWHGGEGLRESPTWAVDIAGLFDPV